MTTSIESRTAGSFIEEDVGNIALLEHVNIQTPDQGLATLFYVVGMGFTRDPHMSVGVDIMWINLGEQQFHLPTGPAQVLRGEIGIVTPSLPALIQRLEGVAPKLAGTSFGWTEKGDHVDVVCPWGNRFRCVEAAAGAKPQLGIPYVEFGVPVGAATGIAAFYERVMGAPAGIIEDDGASCAVVDLGVYQRLRFRETDDVLEYDGHHIAVYIANFSQPYDFLASRGLITEEPRNHQLRFLDIVHPDTGAPLFRLEHEVRSLRHAMYRRPLVNRTIGEFLQPRRVGNVTLME